MSGESAPIGKSFLVLFFKKEQKKKRLFFFEKKKQKTFGLGAFPSRRGYGYRRLGQQGKL
jgi:hypothetical protein